MNFYNFVYAILILRWYLVLAQQSCYWHDSSEVANIVNCYSSQDSACCWPTDFCLSNGLCYNPKGFYRGACTVKDWSNTSVCLTQFCGEINLLDVFECSSTPSSGEVQWWCGDTKEVLPCQSGVNASFVNYPTGSILGTAPVASTSSPPMHTWTQSSTSSSSFSAHLSTEAAAPTQTLHESTSLSIATGVASTASASTSAAASAQSRPQSSSLPTAIGAGIGVPLGIAAIGLLAFLVLRGAKSSDGTQSSGETKSTTLSHENKFKDTVEGPRTELRDNQRPYGLASNRRAEMPGDTYRREME